MDYEAFKNLSFEDQIGVLIGANMLSKKGSLELIDARKNFPDLNAYELQTKLGLCQLADNIFKDFEDEKTFKASHYQEINAFLAEPSNENMGHIIQKYMMFFKGGRSPEQAISFARSLLPDESQ